MGKNKSDANRPQNRGEEIGSESNEGTADGIHAIATSSLWSVPDNKPYHRVMH